MSVQNTPARRMGWKILSTTVLGVGMCIGVSGCVMHAPQNPSPATQETEGASLTTVSPAATPAPAMQSAPQEAQSSPATAPTSVALATPSGSAAPSASASPSASAAPADSAASANPPGADDDDNLAELQNAKVQFPPKIRLGVVHWRAVGAPATAADLVFTDPDMQKEVSSHLQAGGRVTSVIFVPAWMTEGLKVGKLRAIAVRCNVDTLLVYDDATTVSSLGLGEPIIGSCAAEAILLDAKTGLIPATFSAAGDHTAAAPPRDVDPQPERDGVAQRASLEAVDKIADAAAGQLNAMP